MRGLAKTLTPPALPTGLDSSAIWLAGEGAGSWFVISSTDDDFSVSRYSPKGALECSGTFRTEQEFFIDEPFTISYPSHCAKVTIEQDGKRITLISIL